MNSWREDTNWYLSREWRSIRWKIVQRDKLRCQRCDLFSHGGRFLQVHHIIPRSEEWDDSPQNLITLCGECHDWVECSGLRSFGEIKRSGMSLVYARRIAETALLDIDHYADVRKANARTALLQGIRIKFRVDQENPVVHVRKRSVGRQRKRRYTTGSWEWFERQHGREW